MDCQRKAGPASVPPKTAPKISAMATTGTLSRCGYRGRLLLEPADAVLRVHEGDLHPVAGKFLGRVLREDHDDEAVAGSAEARGGAVEGELAGARAGDGVGRPALTVGDVGDFDFLALR